MELHATREIILQLKAIRGEYHLSYGDIKGMLEKNGDFLSSSTLHRVFAENSEDDSFSYERTLAPLVRAMLYQDNAAPAKNAAADDRIEGLKAVIMLKNVEIAQLQEIKEHLEARVEFLLEQIDKNDRRMDEKDEFIRKLMEKVL